MRTSRFGIGAISLCLAAMLAYAAGPAWAAPLVVTGKDNGKTLTLPVGQELVVDLNLGAGQYVLAPDFDASILALMGQSIHVHQRLPGLILPGGLHFSGEGARPDRRGDHHPGL